MGKGVTIFLLIILTLVNASVSISYAQEGTVYLTLVVRDAKTKQPIADAKAKVFQQISFSPLISGDNPGEFTYRMDLNKECLFGFYKEGYITKSISLSTTIDGKYQSKVLPEYKFDVFLLQGKTSDEEVSNPKSRLELNPKDLTKFTETPFDFDKLADNEKMLQAMNLFLDNYYKEKNKAKATESISFEERMKKKVDEENIKLKAELDKLKREVAEKEREEAETQLALAQAEENKKMVEEFKRQKKESEERLKMANEAEREKMKREEEARLSAEFEKSAKLAEEKKKLEMELATVRKQAAEERARLDAAERERADAEFARKEAEEAAKKKGLPATTTTTLSPAEAKKRAEAERKKKEEEAKRKQEADAALRIKAEQMKKEEEEKEKQLALAMANDEQRRKAREIELLEREKEAAILSNEDCDAQSFLDKCKKRLGDYSFVQAFKVENKFATKPDGIKYNIVCVKDASYMLTVCQGLGGRLVVTIYDNNKKIVATSYNKKTKKHLSKIDFVADRTGVYYFNFVFESEIGCGTSVLGMKK